MTQVSLMFRLILTVCCLLAASMATAAARPLDIGIFPRYSASQTEQMFRPIADYLSEQLDRPVRLITTPDFPSFWQLVKQDRFDLVHYNQYHYLKAHKRFGHRAILRNEENGQNLIHTVIAVRADSPFHSIGDLRGGKILFGGGRGAMMSYIVARHILQQAGLQPGDYLASFSKTPVGAVRDMFFGQGDAVGIGHTVLEGADMPWKKLGSAPPRILLRSKPLPLHPWAVTARVDRKLAGDIKNALLSLNNTSKGRQLLRRARLTGLHPAYDSEYDPARVIVAQSLNEHY